MIVRIGFPVQLQVLILDPLSEDNEDGRSDSFPVWLRALILDLFASEMTFTCFGENKRNFDRIFVSLMQSMMHDDVYE